MGMDRSNDDYRRWLAAETDGRDDDADEAFEAMFRSVDLNEPAPLSFTARTMTAVATAAAVDARRARQARLAITSGSVVAGAAAVYAGAAEEAVDSRAAAEVVVVALTVKVIVAVFAV